MPEVSLGFTKLDDKWSRIDIKATIDNEKIVNIEMQLEPDLEMARRSTYYGSWLIANQLTSADGYEKLKDVILINILNFNLFETPDYHKETITVEKNNMHYELIPYIKYHFIELPKFRKNVRKINSKLEAWLAIIDSKDWGLIQMAKEVDEIFFDAIIEIDAILHNKELRYILDKRYEAMREKASKLAYAEKKGIEQGVKQGIKQGIKQGVEQGVEQEKLEIAKEMLKDNVDAETIMRYTCLSKEEIENLKSKL